MERIQHWAKRAKKDENKLLEDLLKSGDRERAAAVKKQTAELKKAEKRKEVDRLLLLFTGSVVELPVRLCAFYGFRRSEVLGLKWDAIDFNRRTITIETTLQQGIGGNYEDETKTESSMRTLPMPQSIYDLLKHHRELQNERLKLMGGYYIESENICTWPNGAVITPNYLSTAFHSVISKSTLPQVRLHDLRHSAATNLLELGFNVVQVAEWLGHESPNTTLKFYGHAVKSSKAEMADALEKVLEKC